MRCDKMHATISVKQCLANQSVLAGGEFNRNPHVKELRYPGCKGCPTGALARAGKLDDNDLQALLAGYHNRMNPPADVVTETVRSEASGVRSNPMYPAPRRPEPAAESKVTETAQKLEEAVMEKEKAGMEGKKKQCSRCKKMKPLEEFLQDKKARDGHRKICLECNRAYQNDWASGKRKDAARSQPLKSDPQNIEQETAEPQRGQPTPAPDMANGHASRLTPHPSPQEEQMEPDPARETAAPICPQNEDLVLENQLLLDFSCYPEVLKEINRLAHHAERPVEVQARFMLKTMLVGGWNEEMWASGGRCPVPLPHYDYMFINARTVFPHAGDISGIPLVRDLEQRSANG
jgi:hypothetical protein